MSKKIRLDCGHEIEIKDYFFMGYGEVVFGEARVSVTLARNYCKGCKYLYEPLYMTGADDEACGGCKDGSNNKRYK